MHNDTKQAIAQYSLVKAIPKANGNQHAYTVTVGGVSISLPDFCKRLGLKYPSVIQALQRKAWPTGIYVADFKKLVEGMVARKRQGTCRCPTCGIGSLPAKYSPQSGLKLTPHSEIVWREPDGSLPVYTPTKEPT